MWRTDRAMKAVASTLLVALALGAGLRGLAEAQVVAPPVLKVDPRLVKRLGFLLLRAPDLQVAVSGPTRVLQGQDIDLKIVVSNKGTAAAPGTKDGAPGQAYMVDIVLSADSVIPVEWATQPVYQGLTKDDFVEDMLMLGGRVSNTDSLAPGAQATYTLKTHIPARTPPGIYYLAAVADAGENVAESRENNNVRYYMLRVGAAADPGTRKPAGVNLWVMPYAVGNTPVNRIKPSGFTDYTDSLSGFSMVNAPFGSHLGLRHGYDERLPNAAIAYYRWSYRRTGAPAWQEFSQPVGVHYSKRVGTEISFPVYSLGPKSVNSMSLYEFRPHAAPTVAGAVTAWPTSDWFGDIYSGFLESRGLADGPYEIKLEVFNPAGAKVLPGGATFRFIVPTGTTPDGTITTAVGAPSPDGGYVFPLRVDNRACEAYIDEPVIGSTAVGQCGFLLYDPAVAVSSEAAKVRISFFATQPDNRARFGFTIIRGINTASTAEGEITAAAAGVYTGDGSGHFQHSFVRTELLGPLCPEKAAFSANLHAYAKATTGWHQRISQLDAYHIRAFAIAPQ